MQQSGVLYVLSRAGDVTTSTFKDKPLAGALTHVLWQTHLRVTLGDICSARSRGRALADGSEDGGDGKT